MDLDAFVARVVASTQHRCLYHFTDDRNLPSIRAHGLLSMRQLRARNIRVAAPGGNEWSLEADIACGMDAYVHLCFMDSHPMEYKAKNEGRFASSTFLKIRPEVIKIPGVMATDDVANKSGVCPILVADMLDTLDIDVIYDRTNWCDADIKSRRNVARRHEVLVPDHIPIQYILNLPNG